MSTYFYTQDGVVKAVDEVSYKVDRGEVIALVGESGCGKTVSALSIVRLIQEPPGKIVSGQVDFDGTDLLKLSRQAMPQGRGDSDRHDFPGAYDIPQSRPHHRPPDDRGTGDTSRDEEKGGPGGGDTPSGTVGITEAERRVKEYPHKFSGGMRQRVMMAMAISCQPKLIIADEPTTAVDVTIQAQLLEMHPQHHQGLGHCHHPNHPQPGDSGTLCPPSLCHVRRPDRRDMGWHRMSTMIRATPTPWA